MGTAGRDEVNARPRERRTGPSLRVDAVRARRPAGLLQDQRGDRAGRRPHPGHRAPPRSPRRCSSSSPGSGSRSTRSTASPRTPARPRSACPGKAKFGSVGPALPGVEVKIAEDGEILVRGRNVFLGYYKDPEATDDTLVDGWLHSGDLGEFDDEGFLCRSRGGRRTSSSPPAGRTSPRRTSRGLSRTMRWSRRRW